MRTRDAGNKKRMGLVAAVGLVAGVLAVAGPQSVGAVPTVIASDMVGSGSTNLISFTTVPAFSSPGDGFHKFQRGVSPTIPFAVLDDTLATFPGDTLGIIDDNNTDEFFGVVDTVNGDTTATAGEVEASWVFDISGATDLSVRIDMGAMGDFEAADSFEWTYSIDGGAPAPLFSLVADEAADRTYTLAGGFTTTLNDPLDVGSTQLSNVLQTVSSPIAGSGNQLSLVLTATADGGSEAVAFQNIEILAGTPGSGGPTPGDLVFTEVMQNPAAVSDGAGEWFEIKNVSGQPIDLEGWTISDDDIDSFVVASSVVVPAGGYVVFGNNADSGTNGGVTVDYQYSEMFLSNGADELKLTDPLTTEFDHIGWDNGVTWPDPNGKSMSLDPGSTDITSNDDGANWCEASSPYGAGDLGTPGGANPDCVVPPAAVKVHDVQGSGASVAITTPVEVQAVVTSLFTRDDVLDGFFVQEEDADADADPATSEGIFVFCRGNCPAVTVGNLVTVTGTPGENFGMSQIDMRSGAASVDGTAPLPTAVDVLLPAAGSTAAEDTFENIEGMVTRFPDTLAVSEYFQLARFGQVVLTDSTRPYQYTHSNTPSVAGYAAFLDDLATRRIILDDDNNDQNDAISDGPDEAYPYPDGGLSNTNRFRGGDTIDGLTGVLHWSWAGSGGTDAWRVRPIQDVGVYSFESANPAPTGPEPVGGTFKVGSFNVLNYFTTIDETSGRTGPCGPLADLDCRGADSVAELDRQRDKIVSAITALDADVLGLVELQNDDDTSVRDLVAALNAVTGPGTYDYVATGFIGGDAIKVGLIYQPATAEPVGSYAILDSSVDPTFIDTKNRPTLVQTFREVATGEKLTVAVNHLKSKGSSCDDVGDPGLDDGQANCPATRTAAAVALANYLATDPTDSGDPDFMIVGDLNAYAMEDPIAALVAAGYTDLIELFGGPTAYSYVFDGQLGYLDHALANTSLVGQVTGVTEWHVNADEVPLFDYNDDIRDVGEASFERESGVLPIYAPDPLRSSDHDPVVVGLDLDSIPDDPTCDGLPATHVGTLLDDVIVGTDGDDVIVTFDGDDTIESGEGDDTICSGKDDDTVIAGDGKDWVDSGDGDDVVDAGNGKDVVIGGPGDDEISGGNAKDDLDGGEGNADVIDGGNGVDRCVDGESTTSCELGP